MRGLGVPVINNMRGGEGGGGEGGREGIGER